MSVSYETGRIPERQPLLGLYDAVGWGAYTQDPDALEAAIAGSSWVATAWDGTDLIGLCRVVSDDLSIAYLQDILVHPEHHRRGIGRRLMEQALARFEHVRQLVLLTDDRPEQLAFYRSVGLSCLADLKRDRMNAFVRIRGVELA